MTGTGQVLGIDDVVLAEQSTAVVRGDVAPEGVAAFVGAALGEVLAVVQAQGLAPVGMPFARYDVGGAGFRVEAGFPYAAVVSPSGRVTASTLPGGPAAVVHFAGPYQGLRQAYQAGERWLSDHGRVLAGAPWESYLDGPEVDQPRTDVYWPLAG